MARPDWSELQKQFLSDYAATGISPKEWCESQGLKYTTAKRYIKAANKTANSQIKSSAKSLAEDRSLTPQQKKFIVEYLIDGNATQAAIRAGYSEKTAQEQGYQLLRKASVANEIANQQKQSLSRTLIDADDVLAKAWNLATFDANELSQYRVGCCHHCWGADHNYQWSYSEYQKALTKASARGQDAPDCSGGTDFNLTLDPNPDCPVCGGEGMGRVYMHDTRKLSASARLAYSGTKVTQNGIEILSISRERMFEMIMKRIGLADSETAQKLQYLEMTRRELEIEKLRREIDTDKEQPITRMEVVIVGENGTDNADTSAG
ncbi:terminase small subunit [Morganella psychrotolerans]|uniref:Terminase small subunit n=1 Tax=Morganella psychrotolerans TaxID=368603 RepID=A0A1B8HQN2_9GAMM|nr:terminase small subunit [Morganella psychrotolerans]OBU11703.1 terminase small subunit [Morganella psychrotolerans]